MVVYKCKCGEELVVSNNSEKMRKVKKQWKKDHDKKKVGHGWSRLVVSRR